MFKILQELYAHISYLDDKYADHRSDGFFILGSPMQMIGFVLAYYIFVKHLGPKLMEKRPPFELKSVILVYNVLQVALNLYLGLKIVYHLILENPYPDLGCMLPMMNHTRLGLLELRVGYFYFLLKIADYLDTVFFVLRKRSKQVNFLHVYHHIMVSVGGFMYMRYLPGGHISGLATLNSWVHAVMYFYYFISALRPELRNSLWWKKYITQIQLLQFAMLTVHFAKPLLHSDCSYPKMAAMFAFLQNVFMGLLFLDFYYKAYLRKPKSKVANGKVREQTLKAK